MDHLPKPGGYTSKNWAIRSQLAALRVPNAELPPINRSAFMNQTPIPPIVLEFFEARKAHMNAAAALEALEKEGKATAANEAKVNDLFDIMKDLRKQKAVKNYLQAESIKRNRPLKAGNKTLNRNVAPVKNTHSALFGKTLRKLRRKSRKGSRGNTRKRRNALRV